jgi:hypothetical protein
MLDDSIIHYLLVKQNDEHKSNYMILDSKIRKEALNRKRNLAAQSNKHIMFPMNVNRNHWVLVCITCGKEAATFTVYDPLNLGIDSWGEVSRIETS